jgi:hypothetical protein
MSVRISFLVFLRYFETSSMLPSSGPGFGTTDLCAEYNCRIAGESVYDRQAF